MNAFLAQHSVAAPTVFRLSHCRNLAWCWNEWPKGGPWYEHAYHGLPLCDCCMRILRMDALLVSKMIRVATLVASTRWLDSPSKGERKSLDHACNCPVVSTYFSLLGLVRPSSTTSFSKLNWDSISGFRRSGCSAMRGIGEFREADGSRTAR